MTVPAAAPPVPVFDVGGVLLDWNPRHLYRKIFDDESAMETFLATVCTPAWNVQMDAGKTFDEGVAELVALHPEHESLIRAYHERWQEMIPRAVEGTVALLTELRARHPAIYAITNFSAEKFALEQARWPFLTWFDGIVVSAHERVIKPDPEIYRRLLDRYGLEAGGCLFIDDSPANVEAARAVGMQAVPFTSPDALRADLQAGGLL